MKPRILPVVALLALAAGCSGVTVHSSTAPSAQLERYRTWAWYPQAQSAQPVSIAEQHIANSLSNNLQARGLMPATNGQPDFYVSFHVITQERVSTTGGPMFWGPAPYWGYYGPPADIYTYTQGTIVVDFIDPSTNHVFWRGTASSAISQPETPSEAQIDKSVGRLMNQYPVNLAAANRPTG
jgi:hypothetical protein